jgi:hypothetical protein
MQGVEEEESTWGELKPASMMAMKKRVNMR